MLRRSEARAAFLAADVQALEQLWADGYVVSSPLQQALDKRRVLELLRAGRVRRESGREELKDAVKILTAKTDADIRACFRVMKVLRPHLEESSFVSQVRRQEAQGYRLAFIRTEEGVVAAAGYRFAEFLAWGRVLYVDDLITDPAMRGQGYGGSLMDWLIERARQEGCAELHLDSGYQRHDAHRLYLNKGLDLASHHFSLKLVRK